MCLNNWYTDSLVSVCLDRQTGDVRLFKQEGIPVGCVQSASANCISFNNHQMSALMGKGVLKWTSLNRSPVLVTRCHYHRARAGGDLYSEVPCVWGVGCGGVGVGPCTVRSMGGSRSNVQGGRARAVGALFNDGQPRLKTLPSRNFVGGW